MSDRNKLLQDLAFVLQVEASGLMQDRKLNADGFWDSLAQMSMTAALIAYAGAQVSAGDLQNLETVGDFLDYADRLRGDTGK
ncbi:hypothetical protein NKW84_16850 [Acetobacter senegalensis]|uniref:hypothetical protein n=1 Tax=Acetobacter senegalensis TaxID=446692 RepID=UPI00209CE7FA|nr:hypothetical protein [Acetobacter senegalensis]MCP1197503.1 hypothetical protein [Acetobacter senegalensis]